MTQSEPELLQIPQAKAAFFFSARLRSSGAAERQQFPEAKISLKKVASS